MIYKFYKIFLSLLLITGLTGCIIAERRPWSEAIVYETAHYTVHTNAGPEAAREIGELMERALIEYEELTGHQDEYDLRFLINAYASRGEYETAAKEHGFPAGSTTGFYTPQHPAAVHLPYMKVRRMYPQQTLLHEGMHQFMDRTMSFSPAEGQKLPAIPLWLNEGLATYMEGALTDDKEIIIGHINKERLIHLQRLILKSKPPSLREIFSKRYGEPFSADDYAVAWGVVHILYNDAPESLKRYIRELKKVRPTDIFDSSLEAFERHFVRKGSTLEDWEAGWAARIIQFDP